MDEKSLTLLEFPKILERLAGYCSFALSAEKARALRPSADLFEARHRQEVTAEAVRLLRAHPGMSIGGVRDVRPLIDLARHGGVLAPQELLDIKSTLVAARSLGRSFERLVLQYPNLCAIVERLPAPMGLVDAISRAISERGEVLDTASEKLALIRRELRMVHDRLLAKLQKMIADPKVAPFLQEALITQRDGRYVIPLRTECKGRVRAIVHDQSQSGATLFVEPLSVVEQNNAYRELQLAERDEERRILAALSAQVGEHAAALEQALEVMAEVDLAFACARYAEELDAVPPQLHGFPKRLGEETPPPGSHPGSVIRLYQARHPLLDPETVVPIDVELDPQTFALVITGPNTGGKTVALKTVGLLTLMAQAGLHIPAQSGSALSVFEGIYADIGDEQSIEQSLSTFSGHITNIIRILGKANHRSLVILDELGAGTDPQEGAALARALLGHLVTRSITTLVTTHHPELKAFAHATPGVTNASVEFDLETLRPTFRLSIGLPGRSNALAIAERLGLPAEIVAEARRAIHPDELRAEDLLDEIHRQRDLARQARAEAEQARREAEALRQELLARLQRIEDERRDLLEQTRRQVDELLAGIHEELAWARKTLARLRQPQEALKEVQERIQALEEGAAEELERHAPELGPALRQAAAERRRAVRVGERVRLRNLGAQGVVTALHGEEVEVSLGTLRVRARLEDIEVPTPSGASPSPSQSAAEPAVGTALPAESQSPKEAATITWPSSPGNTLDLRGQRADEALEALDRYLEAAVYAGLPFVRIIHGKGAGKLRQVVRQALRQHPAVKSFEGGGEEGGEGVTIALLA